MTFRASIEDSTIVIRSPFAARAAIKRIPGTAWDRRRRVWVVAATPAGARAVVEALSRTLPVDDAVVELAGTASPARNDHRDVPVSKTAAWRHQRAAFWFAVRMFGDEVADQPRP